MPTADVFVFPLHLKSFYHYQKDPPTGLLCFKLVAPVGFEPTTLGLEVLCSIQLSYGATHLF